MRVFSRPQPLDRLSLEARVLYTAFSVFLLIGVISSVWLWHDDGIGLSPSAASRWYLGGEATTSPPAPGSSGGPALDLPADAAAPTFAVEKPARAVMETFHFHLFSVPVCLLIVGHLFMMCAWSTRAKVAVLVAASVSTLAHLLGPPAIRFVSDAFAAPFVVSAVVMCALWSLMLVVPIVEMWRAPRGQEERPV